MKYIKLFDNFKFDSDIRNWGYGSKASIYTFKDDFKNEYTVRLLPKSYDHNIYELDFYSTNENGYKHLRKEWDSKDPTHTGMLDITNSGIPFQISNFIFIDIMKDFINNNKKCKAIHISPVEARLSYKDKEEKIPDFKRYDSKKNTRYKLYIRSLSRLNIENWEVSTESDEILLFNNKLIDGFNEYNKLDW